MHDSFDSVIKDIAVVNIVLYFAPPKKSYQAAEFCTVLDQLVDKMLGLRQKLCLINHLEFYGLHCAS